MNIIVVGASGRVGRACVRRLEAQGRHVIACARHLDGIEASELVTPVAFDMAAPLNAMITVFKDAQADAIIFTAGSRGADVIHVDALGAIKTMEAAKGAGIKRYVLLGALFAAELERWDEPEVKRAIDQLPDYYPAKYFADDHLMHSGLDYTIVEPGALVEEARTGAVNVDGRQTGPIAIEDVAAMLVDSLGQLGSVGRVYQIIQGDTPIAQALQ
ncbi:NAD-dependent epimerase/dehydratase [Bifidobacterium actinocoloniiforme DSM 22766]|uniref:NAD-dependent epimerase/dehydratase n=1 Tax=Bifidobacterium actinocoloniiforme DSM 22766 TaxID=1437605 RepID=A0A086YWB4_9BIFI|nr:NAD(P)H-binding protein [Bifidobacterium actinocoloniiforme]AKV55772.1 hypothetical protein AB656_05880 [Bifidobacterium actinocoloniiforme DSM 22766]KFI38564.1 NAD-dependent epimerase/dehydratase [Bifidobacterium actinocoloniiforme DSM 22766]